jgi:VRR-NUC domain
VSRMSKRQIQKLTAEIAEIDRERRESWSGVDENTLTDSERQFVAIADRKGKAVFRAGWPDFFVVDRETGAAIAVETKSSDDDVRPAQARMFAALERHTTIRVMIWQPSRPAVLTPWRKYMHEQAAYVQRFRGSGPRQPVPKRVQTAENENEEG